MTHACNGKHVLVVAALALGGAAAAEGTAAPSVINASSEVGAARASFDSKLQLVKTILAQSPGVQRIPQSDNAQAKKLLADAQALCVSAEAEANAGHVSAALKQVDEALRSLAAASHLVPDRAQAEAQERAHYAELRDTIRTFLNLHKNLAAHIVAAKAQGSAVTLDVARIDTLVEKAERKAADSNFQEANALLGDACKFVVSALNRMMTAETITYGLKFETPAEEFQYELARNTNYEGLVPIALAQRNATREATALADSHVRQSRDLRAAAQQHAAGGDYGAALKAIQEATGHLQSSLRIAGVVVPQFPD